MAKPRVIAVVPARMGSSRYPGKPLASILGLPMVEHVRRRAELCSAVDEVWVATCDQEIFDAVVGFGGRAIMTAATHERCTERVREAMASLAGDIVAIVQGDEPLVRPEVIESVVSPLLSDAELQCVNLLSAIESPADFEDRSVVKAALNLHGDIMYFSRAAIPYFRHQGDCPIYRQTGIWALRADFLKEYVAWPETPFERVESVDMLRVLEHGYRIHGTVVDYATVGVDHVEDIARIEDILRGDSEQNAILKRIIQ